VPIINIYLGPVTRDGRDTMRGVIGSTAPRQFVSIDVAVSGVANATSSWLSVTYYNSRAAFPLDTINIAERFPPLRTRVPHWTKAQLLAAVNHGGRAESNLGQAKERDRILLEELLKRSDLTAEDFKKMLECHADGGGMAGGSSIPLAIRLATPGDAVARFAAAVQEYYKGKVAIGVPGMDRDQRWFMLAIDQRGFDGFCDLAVRFLTNRVAIRESLRYAATYCHTREAFDAVLGLDDKPEYFQDRVAALDRIGESLQR
jgi:hypothetical protein